MTSVVFYDAFFRPSQSLGLGFSSYTLGYTCAGQTVAIDCVVVHDQTDHMDIQKGDIIISVNGQRLINTESSEFSNYDEVIRTLGNMNGEQRILRFMRSPQECHDESVQAAIVAITPEEATLLFDPRYPHSCPDLVQEVTTSSSSHVPSQSSMFLNGGLHYNPIGNAEDEVRREAQRFSEELRLAEEEDARLIEIEVQRQLEDLARKEHGQIASVSSSTTSSMGDDERRRLEESRANGRQLDDQIQFKRKLEEERRELLRLQAETDRRREVERREHDLREQERRRREELEFHQRMTSPPSMGMLGGMTHPSYMNMLRTVPPFFPPYGLPTTAPLLPGAPTAFSSMSGGMGVGGTINNETPSSSSSSLLPNIEEIVNKKIAAVEIKMTMELEVAKQAAIKAENEARAIALVLQEKVSHMETEQQQQQQQQQQQPPPPQQQQQQQQQEKTHRLSNTNYSNIQLTDHLQLQLQRQQEQQLLKDFLQAQEAAHNASFEARRTAEAVKMQEELFALEQERHRMEIEKRKIEEDKRRAIADIEQRTKLAKIALEAEAEKAAKEAEAREAELHVLEARAQQAQAAELRAQEEIKLAEARALAEAQMEEAKREEIRLQQRQQELEQMELERKNHEAAETLRKTREEEMERKSKEIRKIHEEEMERITTDQINAANEIRRIREAEAEKITKEKKINLEVRRRISREVAKIQEMDDDDDDDDDNKSSSVVSTMSRKHETTSTRSLLRKKRIDEEVARRVEAQKALLLDQQLQIGKDKVEAMQSEIDELKQWKKTENAFKKLLEREETLSHATVRSRNGSIVTTNTHDTSNTRYTGITDLERERIRLLELRRHLEEEKKRVELKKTQAMKEADLVRAIELKHQLPSSNSSSPIKPTSSQDRSFQDRGSPDKDKSSDILGLELSDTVRYGQRQVQVQGQRKWENNMTMHMTAHRSTEDRATDEVTRVTESAHIIAAKIARLQDEKRLLDQMLLDDDVSSRTSHGTSRDKYRFHDVNNGNDDHGGEGDGRRALARAQRAISILSNQKQQPSSTDSDRVNGHVNAALDRDNYSHFSVTNMSFERDHCYEEKNFYLDGQGLADNNGTVREGVIPPAPTIPARPLPGTTTRPRSASSSTVASLSSTTVPMGLPSSNNNTHNSRNDVRYGVSPSGTVVSSSGVVTFEYICRQPHVGLMLSPIVITYDDSWGRINTILQDKKGQKPWTIRERKLYSCVVTEVQGDAKHDVKKGDILLTLNQWPMYVKADSTLTEANHLATIQQQIVDTEVPCVFRFYRSTKIRPSATAVTLSLEDSESFFAGHSQQATFNYTLSSHGPSGIDVAPYAIESTTITGETITYYCPIVLSSQIAPDVEIGDLMTHLNGNPVFYDSTTTNSTNALKYVATVRHQLNNSNDRHCRFVRTPVANPRSTKTMLGKLDVCTFFDRVFENSLDV